MALWWRRRRVVKLLRFFATERVATLYYATIKLLYNYLLIDNVDSIAKRLY
jgi:hypothetical protein